MSMRFLHIKRAYVTDELLSYEVERDMISNTLLLEKIYEGCVHDVCAITEDGEWLMHGRKIDPATLLKLYTTVFIYVHSPSVAYDAATLFCRAHAQRYVSVYSAMDVLTHHTERLTSLIKTQQLLAKIPHEVYVDMQMYNEKITPSELIAGSHIRNIFLPVQLVSSLYRTSTPHIHATRLAHNYAELTEQIEEMRHVHTHITLREHIQGESIYVVSIPDFRHEKIYTTMPLASRDLEGLIYFQEAVLGKNQKEEVSQVVMDVSQALFKMSPVVFRLKVHGKRGIFIEGTIPAYFFILHNHDFLFTVAEAHGISPQIFFEKLHP